MYRQLNEIVYKIMKNVYSSRHVFKWVQLTHFTCIRQWLDPQYDVTSCGNWSDGQSWQSLEGTRDWRLVWKGWLEILKRFETSSIEAVVDLHLKFSVPTATPVTSLLEAVTSCSVSLLVTSHWLSSFQVGLPVSSSFVGSGTKLLPKMQKLY